MYKYFWKRLIDFVIALMMLIVISPFLLFMIICLYLINKGNGVFFTQKRVGKNRRIFYIIKFKTMTDERDAEGNLLSDERRLTKIGKFIRSTSVDELPQLINVLKGDMSLIGPRPLVVEYLPLYNDVQARRHEVKPGITGWAQVNGRNTISWQQKFEYDVWYVNNLSFVLDIKILYMTIKNVINKKDIGLGIEDEVDDLGWYDKRNWAEQEYLKKI